MRRVCGICGIVDADMRVEDRERRVATMAAALVHRGPDDAGTFSAGPVSLGFRRLAVIDLVTGNQPLRLEDDRAVLVLNGEIYNFRELRAELEAKGHRFHTQGDVEVFLRLYDAEGIGAVKRLRGMFAFALWDAARRTLFLGRDRFGIKPLFVARRGGRLAFASEVATLLAGGFPESREIDRLELRHYLWQKYPSPGGSILAGVQAVPPGHVLELGPHGERSTAYWKPPEEPVADPGMDAASEVVSDLLRQAVRRQLVADVPLGVFLSGGLDSSTLATLVREQRSVPLETFAVGFDGEGAVSELPFAGQVARGLGSVHRELAMDPHRVASDLDAILGRLDGPLGDATAIPTWYVSRLARESVTVALSGEGADELFGGYPRQRYDVGLDRIGLLGRRLLPSALAAAGRPVSQRLRRRLALSAGLARQLDWSRVFEAEQIDELAAAPLPPESALLEAHADLARAWERLAAHDPVHARLEADRALFLPGCLLPKVDRMSMAVSLEVRVPYLDEDLADYVLALPGKYKVRGRQGKVILRRLAQRLLPQEILRRPKQGFDVPIGAWLRGPLREAMTDLLSVESVRRRGLFRPEVVTRWVREHLAGEPGRGEPLWLLVALEGWMSRVLGSPGGSAA
jgi:asparagine synthase (glutamine-hydrolysing)